MFFNLFKILSISLLVPDSSISKRCDISLRDNGVPSYSYSKYISIKNQLICSLILSCLYIFCLIVLLPII
nr:MAG TPA: hypothetical protein [Caudoviricetes sp.]